MVVPSLPSEDGTAATRSQPEEASSISTGNLGSSSSIVSDAELTQRLGPVFSLRVNSSSSSFEQSSEEGAALYRNFLAEEFQRRNLPHPAEYLRVDSTYNRLSEPASGDLTWAANQLRLLSDEFSQSPLRQWVQEQAAAVPLESLDFDAFSELLYGLFQEGGVTWERVIVLFHFCADLAIRAFRERLPQQFSNIVDWSFRFFAGDKMLNWVAAHGGWINVLQKSVNNAYKIARIGFFVMGILAFAAYIWKSR